MYGPKVGADSDTEKGELTESFYPTAGRNFQRIGASQPVRHGVEKQSRFPGKNRPFFFSNWIRGQTNIVIPLFWETARWEFLGKEKITRYFV